MDRNETIKRIRTALKRRSGKPWSVTGGRGTAWGWITVDAPPARRTWRRELIEGRPEIGSDSYRWVNGGKAGSGYTSPDERAELAALMGLESVHSQGISIPASGDYYREHIDRAEGRKPAVLGQIYWD